MLQWHRKKEYPLSIFIVTHTYACTKKKMVKKQLKKGIAFVGTVLCKYIKSAFHCRRQNPHHFLLSALASQPLTTPEAENCLNEIRKEEKNSLFRFTFTFFVLATVLRMVSEILWEILNVLVIKIFFWFDEAKLIYLKKTNGF